MRTLRSRLVIAVFCLGLSLPLVFTFAPGNSDNPKVGGPRSGLPGLPTTRGEIKSFPGKFERYFNHNFGLRDSILAAYNTLNHYLIRRSSTVIFGRDDWLFFSGNEQIPELNSEIIRDYCGQLRFSDDQLRRTLALLQQRTRHLEQLGTAYWWVIAPNKHTVYPQLLPPGLQCRRGQSLRQQLMQYLSGKPHANVLDLAPAFKIEAARQTDPLFRRTDTHWNGRGAWLAHRQITTTLTHTFPGIRNIDRHFAGVRSARGGGGDLAGLLGLQQRLSENWTQVRLKKYRAQPVAVPADMDRSRPQQQPGAFRQTGVTAPDLLMLHDSFVGSQLRQSLAESFSNTLFAWHSVNDKLPLALIEQVKPHIVVHEFVERNLARPAFHRSPITP